MAAVVGVLAAGLEVRWAKVMVVGVAVVAAVAVQLF
jgi:hypothetical protein